MPRGVVTLLQPLDEALEILRHRLFEYVIPDTPEIKCGG
jgi:hypothetical protein